MPILTLQLVLAAVAAVCALLAILSSRKCAKLSNEMRAALSSVASARSRIEAHDAELDRVTDALRTLRGMFYAERRKSRPDGSNSDSEPEATSAATIKDALRRKVGLVAGRPAPHS